MAIRAVPWASGRFHGHPGGSMGIRAVPWASGQFQGHPVSSRGIRAVPWACGRFSRFWWRFLLHDLESHAC
eukprot:10846814-Lingulodinium_polyedra.AAC.1